MNEETLIFYYYNDGLSNAERQQVALALQKDPALAERYRLLSGVLDALRHPQEVAVPEGLEHRLATTIQRAARVEAAESAQTGISGRARLMRPGHLAWGSALTAVLALGMGIGFWLAPRGVAVGPADFASGSDTPPLVAEQNPASEPAWSAVAFHRGLESYFRSGTSNLVRLPEQQDMDRTALYAALLNQNRLYAQLALNHDAPDVARVLRSFEPTLIRLASEGLTPEEESALQAKLAFEFSVMLTKFSRDASQQEETHKQEITL